MAFLALPAAAAPLRPGTPRLELRIEGLFGQPTTRLGSRGGGGFGAAWRLTDQLSVVGDIAARAAPRGGIGSLAFGMQGTLDMTPIAPYLELCVVDLSNQSVLGYSLATRFGLGADWMFSRGAGIGVVVRSYTPIDPENGNPAISGVEGAIRFVLLPGAF